MTDSSQATATARAQKFSCRNLNVGSLGTENERYVIPSYQRAYAWTSAQVSQLMQDLLDFYRKDTSPSTYSLGTIVCDEEEPGVFSILDGQQRLTTIDLLLGEIRNRLNKPASKTHKRIISAYRYLSNMETSDASPLPACEEQRNCIVAELSKFIEKWNLRGDQDTVNFLTEFEARIQNQVNIRRVVIPLSDKVENEAPTMFEIINIRGQRLSALDILKSRLLSRFNENDRKGRALFTYLWRTTEEILPSPEKSSKGYNLEIWKKSPMFDILNSETPGFIELTIDEIIDKFVDTTTPALSASNTKSQNSTTAVNKDDNVDETANEQFVPPIDMMNMLVIANELIKYEEIRTTASSGKPYLEYDPLTTTDFGHRFDHIIQSEVAGTSDVWRLMGALSIVLQTVGNWGRYRNACDNEFLGEPDAFNQLIQTFMASNSFSTSGQYWLLVLSATALDNSLGFEGTLPTNYSTFLAMKKPSFTKIRKLAEFRLLTWAFRVAAIGQNHTTEAVFRLIEETPSQITAQDKMKDAQNAVKTAATRWRYDDGSISQFDLFLTDYALWVDGHTTGNCNFSSLKKAMQSFVDEAQSNEQTEIARALRNFDWTTFEKKALTLRIVGRSDIEHWLSRSRSSLGRDEKAADEELLLRHGYGNLALINQSDNSTLGNGAPSGKAELVLNSMKNPTAKLLWLAVFSQSFTNLSGRHVEDLSKFWASYIGRFPFAR